MRDRRLGPRGNRHEPLLVTLAANHQERLAGPDSAAREADQLARPQSRAIEELEQGEIAYAPRASPLAARSSAASNMRWTSSSSRIRGNGRSKRGRGSADEGSSRRSPSSTRKPKNRRSAADRRATVEGARSAQSLPSRDDILGEADPIDPSTSADAVEVVAIGSERKFRRARFGRHHVEEPVDKRSVVGDHVRERASAAIIRAVKSWLGAIKRRRWHDRGGPGGACPMWWFESPFR